MCSPASQRISLLSLGVFPSGHFSMYFFLPWHSCYQYVCRYSVIHFLLFFFFSNLQFGISASPPASYLLCVVVVQSLWCVYSLWPHGLQHTNSCLSFNHLPEFAQTHVHWLSDAMASPLMWGYHNLLRHSLPLLVICIISRIFCSVINYPTMVLSWSDLIRNILYVRI